MLLNRIDFPHELIKAAKENKLVVFAGAGVSVGKPTRYPDFCQLINDIYTAKTGIPIAEKDFAPDIYAGDLDRQNVPVHDLVANKLNLPRKQPNRLHKSIVNLFRNSEMRIVTTNFDLMLEKAAQQVRYGTYNCFSFPALPDGCDFSGIVHLHGDVQNSKNIVITDSDFGKAYLIDGYATRFITNVFKTYTVLFIGYSYKDVMMSYLTKAFSTSDKKSAFILTDDKTIKWESIGITPLFFEYHNFDQLYQGFEEFTDYCGRQLLDVDDMINIIASNDPPDDEASISVIKELFTDIDSANLFLSRIRKEEWFDFFYTNGFIDNLFNPKVVLNDVERVIADWIARYSLNENLLAAIELSSNLLNPEFERLICVFMVDLSNEAFSQYVVLMLSSIKEAWIMHRVLEKTIELSNDTLAVHVFVRMICPAFVLGKGFGLDKKTEIKDLFPLSICLTSEWDLLQKSIKNSELYYFLASEATRIIQYFYDVEYIVNNPRKYNNFSLDVVELDSFSDDNPASIIANVILVSLSKIHDENYSRSWIEVQLKTNKTLLRRIALYHLGHSLAASSIRQSIIMGLDDVSKPFEKKETYYLLREHLNDVDSNNSSEVIEKIESQYSEEDEDGQYEIYNLIHWLSEHISNENVRMKLSDFLDSIISVHPDYVPSAHPDSDVFWGEMTFSDGVNPIIVKSVIGKSFDQIDSVLKECRTKYHADSFDIWASLRKASADEPNWACKCIIDYINIDPTNPDLAIMVEGVSLSSDYSFAKSFFDEILETTIPLDISLPLCRLMCSMVHSYEKIDSNQEKWILDIIKHLWTYSRSWNCDEEPSYQRALNSPSGNIGLTLYALLAKCENKRIEIINYIDSYIDDKDVDFQCILISRAASLYAINSVWAETRLFSLLKSEDNNFFSAYWESLISVSRNMSFEYAHSIKPYYDYAVNRMSCFREQTTIMFAKQFAILVTYESSDPLSDAVCFIRNTDEKANDAFLSEVTYILRDLATEKLKKSIWRRWLRRFVENRISNIPKSLTGHEVAIILEWSIYIIQEDFYELVALIIKSNEIDTSRLLHFLYELNNYENYKNNSKAAVEVLNFLDSRGVSFALYIDNIEALYDVWKKNGISAEDERIVKNILLKSNVRR